MIDRRINKHEAPAQASRNRAQAHLDMYRELCRLEQLSVARGKPAAYVAVIRGERQRQDRMVRQFRAKYGPGAQV